MYRDFEYCQLTTISKGSTDDERGWHALGSRSDIILIPTHNQVEVKMQEDDIPCYSHRLELQCDLPKRKVICWLSPGSLPSTSQARRKEGTRALPSSRSRRGVRWRQRQGEGRYATSKAFCSFIPTLPWNKSLNDRLHRTKVSCRATPTSISFDFGRFCAHRSFLLLP